MPADTPGLKHGDRVRLVNGKVGTFLWAYSNPTKPGDALDRANVAIGDETWSCNLHALTTVGRDSR